MSQMLVAFFAELHRTILQPVALLTATTPGAIQKMTREPSKRVQEDNNMAPFNENAGNKEGRWGDDKTMRTNLSIPPFNSKHKTQTNRQEMTQYFLIRRNTTCQSCRDRSFPSWFFSWCNELIPGHYHTELFIFERSNLISYNPECCTSLQMPGRY